MGKLVNRVLTLICFTFLVISPLSSTIAQYSSVDIVVPHLEEPVDINGNIGMWEWSEAVQIDVIFRFYNQTQEKYVENRTGAISLKHDCENLYILVSMSDSPDSEGSWFAVFYDADGDCIPGEDWDDEKAIIHEGPSLDAAIVVKDWYNDTDLGGSHDVTGASGFIPVEHITYEMLHPLDSGDAPGNDVSAPPGSTITAMFMVGDPRVDADYALAYTEAWKPQYNLKISLCEAPVGGILESTGDWIKATHLVAVILLTMIAYPRLKGRRITHKSPFFKKYVPDYSKIHNIF